MRWYQQILAVLVLMTLTACQACSEKTVQSTKVDTDTAAALGLQTATDTVSASDQGGQPALGSNPNEEQVAISSASAASSDSATQTSVTAANTTDLPEGLKITDSKIGTGAVAEPGKKITVHYIGTLREGIKFDSSRDHGAPFSFVLGAGNVIQGWDLGLKGMKVGGVRKLEISPELAYGRQAVGDVIPANSTLFFEIELLAVD